MPSALRIGLFVGFLCLLVVLSAPVLADEIQHEHPDEAGGDGDLEGVEQWLGDHMGEIHADCADGIGFGTFDPCDDLDDEYAELISRYVTVENDLRSETETSEQYNETRAEQGEYADLREEFDNTYEEYEAARATGDDAEARSQARELQQLADRIEELSGGLETNLDELDETTAADLSNAAQTINSSTAEVRAITLEVEAESFEPTEIDAVVGDTASFAEPQAVSGRLTTENGTGLADAEIVLTDGAQSFSTTTMENGSYEVLYRPARTEVGATNLTVQYRPATNAPYLSAETTETIDVRSTDSELHIENSSTRVAFDDQLVVTGDVQADGIPAPDVDVTVRSEAGTLTTTRTESDGSFRAVTRVPVTMETGTQSIVVQASDSDRALEPSQDSTELTILETATEISVEAISTDDGVDISGNLTADVDADVGTRPVSVHVGNETYDVSTDPDGSYRLSTDPSSEPETVTVRYDESGTNLASSQAETTVENASGGAAPDSTRAALLSSVRDSPIVPLLLGIVLTGTLLVAVYRLSHRNATDTDRGQAQPTTTEARGQESTDSSELSVEALLETARTKLQTDPKATVYASYAAVRTLFDASADQTHWELYDQEHLTEDGRSDDAFYTLTETFERAAFAAEEIDTTQAKSALQAAERYLDTTDQNRSTD